MRVTFLTLVSIFVFHLAAFSQTDIHAVDFRNFTYYPFCAGEETETITVKSGGYSKETKRDDYVDRIWFNIFSIKYGDLNGDKRDEAVILSSCNTGGSGFFTEGFVYSMRAGKPSILARIPGGDRAFGGLRSASVENGILIVERNDAGKDGAACCPQFTLTERYKLVGNKLVAIGQPTSRPYVETERVSFDKGKSGKTFTITMPAGEARQYVLAGRAGQTLSVTVNNNNVSVHSPENVFGTVDVNSYSVRLPTSGDFTIEVRNEADKDVEVTVTIKIQ